MSNPAAFQYPPPKNWQDFESLCRDLWEKIWNDPDTQKNGRSGQAQHGVDIYGRPDQEESWAGVQCKGKDNNLGSSLTQAELEAEVNNAKKFSPALSSWTLATTGPRDSQIQKRARELTAEQLKRGMFSVSVWAWDDIVERLLNYPALIVKWLPQIGTLDPATTQKIDDIDLRTRQIDSNVTEQTNSMASVSESLVELEKKIDGVQNIGVRDILTVEFNSEIDVMRCLVNEFRYEEAVRAFERLKERIWANASDKVKYRVLTNLGNAYYHWHKFAKAGPLFIEAYQYNPDDETSLTNLAIASSFDGDFESVEKYTRKVLEKNPGSINGYCILLQIPPYKDSLETAIALVPEKLRRVSLIAHCLGLVAQNEGKFDIASEFFETAVESDTENNPDYKAYLAATLMQTLSTTNRYFVIGQISTADRQTLERAIELLTSAWERIEKTELTTVHPAWLLNRGIAKKLLGDIEGAFEDGKRAYDLDPTNPEFIRNFAMILLRKQEPDAAIKVLEKAKADPNHPEISTILADIYVSKGDIQNALPLLEPLVDSATDIKSKFFAERTLSECYLITGALDKALDISTRLTSEFPLNTTSYTTAARVAKRRGNEDAASVFIDRAKDLISPDTYISEMVELADTLFEFRRYRDASEYYEAFTDLDQDTRFTYFLLASYYYAGILSKGLDLARRLRSNFGILREQTKIEIAILEETNNLDSSRDLAQEYLKVFPDDLSVKLRLARLIYLLGDDSELDRFLGEHIDSSTVALEDGLTISAFLAQAGRAEESFRLMYELRRSHFSKGEAHSFYIQNFFANDANAWEILHSDIVATDFAVRVERVDKSHEWYLIEDRPEADNQRREFHFEHPTSQKLLGKKVGEKVLLKESAHNTEPATILEIKSKFVYALHETTRDYETMFPERNDFWSMHVGTTDPEPDGDVIDITKIRAILASQSKQSDEVLDLYQTSGLTIGVVADLRGLTALETWEALLAEPDRFTFCSTGNQQTLDDTVSMLEGGDLPRLATDITSIHIARALNVADKIVGHFGKLLIAPTTLFSLYQKLEDTKRNRSVGALAMSERNGQLYKTELTPTDVERQIEYLQDLVEWIKINCDITPHQAGFDMDRDHKGQLRKALLPEFLDTCLIVENGSQVLWTEDERLGQVSRYELHIRRVWLQPLLISLQNRGAITDKEYTDAIVSLLSSNLSHIHFNASLMIEAVRKFGFEPNHVYERMVKRLSGTRTNQSSAIGVAVNFLFELFDAPLSPQRLYALIVPLLDALTMGRDARTLLTELRTAVRYRFRLMPLREIKVLKSIDSWSVAQLLIT